MSVVASAMLLGGSVVATSSEDVEHVGLPVVATSGSNFDPREVGGSNWKWIGEVTPFSVAFDDRSIRRRMDSVDDATVADHPTSAEFLSQFDDATEHTTVDRAPFRPSEPPPRPWLERFDEAEEQTIVDRVPPRASEPPTEP